MSAEKGFAANVKDAVQGRLALYASIGVAAVAPAVVASDTAFAQDPNPTPPEYPIPPASTPPPPEAPTPTVRGKIPLKWLTGQSLNVISSTSRFSLTPSPNTVRDIYLRGKSASARTNCDRSLPLTTQVKSFSDTPRGLRLTNCDGSKVKVPPLDNDYRPGIAYVGDQAAQKVHLPDINHGDATSIVKHGNKATISYRQDNIRNRLANGNPKQLKTLQINRKGKVRPTWYG